MKPLMKPRRKSELTGDLLARAAQIAADEARARPSVNPLRFMSKRWRQSRRLWEKYNGPEGDT